MDATQTEIDLPAQRPDVTFTVPGEPVSKSRHKTGVRGGKVYHYKDPSNARAQDRVGVYYRQARGPGQPSDGGFGVDVVFHVKKRQRRDVDNFIKLVFDGLTGVAWLDDSQVTEVHAKMIHGSSDPRSVIRVFPTSDLPDHLTRQCDYCAQPFRTYESWSSRKYCSRECQLARGRLRRQRTCQHCGKEFRSPHSKGEAKFCSVACKTNHGRVDATCAQCGKAQTVTRSRANRHANIYCNQECQAAYARNRRVSRAKGVCEDCGGATSKKSYRRCRACNITSGNARKGGHWRTILTPEQAEEMKSAWRSGATKTALAQQFKVSTPTVTKAISGGFDDEAS